jgi:outer membrane protein
MKRICVALPLLLAMLVLPLSSLAFEIGARGYYWFPSLDGTVKADEASIIGTTIDFENDLAIEDEDYPSGEVFLGLGRHHLSLTYTDIDYSGKNTITRDIDFSGETYTAGSVVTSSIEYQMIDVHYQYDFIDLENVVGGFSLGAVLQVKYLDGDVSLKDTTGVDEKEEFTIPIPMVGLNLHIGILADVLEARARGTIMTYSGDAIYEIMADISWTPFPFIDIHGGYKRFVIDIDEDDVTLDYDMSGPFLALTVSF